MDESDLRCDLCLIGSLFSDACSSSLCEESLTPCLPNNATFESLSCTFINIHILAVAEALSDTCFNFIVSFSLSFVAFSWEEEESAVNSERAVNGVGCCSGGRV